MTDGTEIDAQGVDEGVRWSVPQGLSALAEIVQAAYGGEFVALANPPEDLPARTRRDIEAIVVALRPVHELAERLTARIDEGEPGCVAVTSGPHHHSGRISYGRCFHAAWMHRDGTCWACSGNARKHEYTAGVGCRNPIHWSDDADETTPVRCSHCLGPAPPACGRCWSLRSRWLKAERGRLPMARRGKGDGSIYQRSDGRWTGALVTWEGGVRKRRAFYGRTRAEAREKLLKAQRTIEDGLPLPSEQLTVSAFLERWLSTKRTDLRPESYRRYDESVRLHIVPELGRLRLSRVTPDQVLSLYAKLYDERGLSGTSVNFVHGVLRGALKDAVRWGLVARNVTDAVTTPRRSTVPTDALSAEQARALLSAAAGDEHEALYVLAVTAGLRLGELQALRWNAVDLDRRRLEVRATYQGNVDGEPVFAPPKTQRSRRTVQLSALAVDALKRHRARQNEQRLAVGSLWKDYGLVFASGFGRALDGNNLRTRSFAPLLERAKLPPMRFHDLRHAAATLLMSEGVPIKAVSELLGHSDVATTLRIYSHVLPTMHGEAANAMDRIFAAKGGA